MSMVTELCEGSNLIVALNNRNGFSEPEVGQIIE
jgi:hypothetical protein